MSWFTYQVCDSMARIQREREWEAEWIRLMAWEFVWRSLQYPDMPEIRTPAEAEIPYAMQLEAEGR